MKADSQTVNMTDMNYTQLHNDKADGDVLRSIELMQSQQKSEVISYSSSTKVEQMNGDVKNAINATAQIEREYVSVNHQTRGNGKVAGHPESPPSDRRFKTRADCLNYWKNLNYTDPTVPKHQNGPDYVLPADSLTTSRPDGAVKIRMGPDRGAMEPVSVVTWLTRPASKHPDVKAMSINRGEETVTWNYREYLRDVRTAAKGFMKLGLLPFHAVGITGFNAPEWFISDLAAIFAGGIATGIYQTNSPEECFHILQDSRANIVVVEDDKHLQKILSIRDRLTELKAIVQYIGEPSEPGVLSWADLMEIGRTVPDEMLDRRIKGLAVNQCCTFIYTSGTTGTSKGVMLSHDNLTYMVQFIIDVHGPNLTNERWVSFLPLSHIAAQGSELYCGIGTYSCVYFAKPDAFRGSLLGTLLEARPTRMLAVPRVFEKMYEAIRAKEQTMNIVQRKVVRIARKIGYKYAEIKNTSTTSTATPFGFRFASAVLVKAQKAVGFDQAKTLVSAGAPISAEVLRYLHSFNIMVREVYGMSEAMLHTLNLPGATKFGSVGRAATSYETRLHEPDATGEGEVCLKGRHVCMGYLHMEDKTAEAIDEEGWLHSGDLGRMDQEGFLFITGRIKEIIITAGGENVAPVPIEDRIKNELPTVSYCVVVGDRKKFLSLLLCLAVEPDTATGLPTSNLRADCKIWVQQYLGTHVTTIQQVLAGINQEFRTAIQAGIDRANLQAVSNAQKVQKWTILPQEFSVAGGELGPTMKMRRPFICKKYSEVIDQMYPDPLQKA